MGLVLNKDFVMSSKTSSNRLKTKAWWRASSEDQRRQFLIEWCHRDPETASEWASKSFDELTAAQKGLVNSGFAEMHEDEDD
jgi:hypothetical protein